MRQDETPKPTTSEVQRAWEARQRAVRSIRVRWTEKHFVVKGGLQKAADGEPFPIENLRFETKGFLAFAGKMVRYEFDRR